MLKGKRIILGVTGSISAYKAAGIVSRLKQLGAEVVVVMTLAAQKFITPLTLQTLSGNPVVAGLFPVGNDCCVVPMLGRTEPSAPTKNVGDGRPANGGIVPHISLAKWADLILIAPATANLIAKLASGLADDALSTLVLASPDEIGVLIAPAMNEQMWKKSVVQENIKKLKSRGFQFINPGRGRLACGEEGEGRLADLDKIIERVNTAVQRRGRPPCCPERLSPQERDLSGKKVLITAGPTQEPIDPVRFITNPSSGKMGYSLAEEASKRGAEVTLISGPVPTETLGPDGVKLIKVKTAQEMESVVRRHFADCDVFISAAAVADWRPKQIAKNKIKRVGDDRRVVPLELEPTPDILGTLGRKKDKRILIGFALETENLIKNAKKKLKEKNLDLIVANKLDSMGKPRAKVKFIDKAGRVKSYPEMPKSEIARQILNWIKKTF